MGFSLLDKFLTWLIRYGQLTVTDHRGRVHVYGTVDTMVPVAIRLNDSGVALTLALRPDLAFGEAYMDGRFTIERGNVRDLIALLMRNLQATGGSLPADRIMRHFRPLMLKLQQANSARRSRQNVAHHYDLSDQLYDLFLDPDRQYSCGYFRTPTTSLEQAQLDKKRHIAAKLLLKRGQRVLEIGSGWGGLALFLAEHYGVEVTGLTLSTEQHAYATERARRAGLSNRVQFKLLDYRAETGSYDRIVSVGMFEHVGVTNYDTFFRTVHKLLVPDGVALLHSIGRADGPGLTNSWLRKYIFPGGYSPALSEVLPSVERAALWATDIEILRMHYAWTLRAWLENFEKNRAQIAKLYDERFCRMWEFYLAACEANFEYWGGMVFQIQMAKDQNAVPFTRDYMVAEETRLLEQASGSSARSA
ncbi:SAM-dependent methyltransferase [Roseiterribacter gracilis]|uniref:Cyclopropane-fatty-acyl-phospholipid synthase n=1 Tax=Roseiterribacter gracilis TaxID=2812848 RepID=A0A8S8XJF7_9PROT|nr:cyclopropane-fatty-acyl-phospholipid synthase [Rhodospirillales bacterium TMPK1]